MFNNINNTNGNEKNQYDFNSILETFQEKANMTNLALNNPKNQSQEEPVEYYTKITNNLLDALMLANITLHQQTVMLAIIRKTFGYNKKTDWISNGQLSKLTGILPHKCSAAKRILIKQKMLIASGRSVGVNKNINEWKNISKVNEQKSPELVKTKNCFNPVSKRESYKNQSTLPESGKKSLPESGKHKRKITDKNNNNIYIQNISLDLSCFKQQPTQSVWSDYLLHRKAKKAPLTQTALNRLASKINEANEKGYDTNDVLADCMLRNWQSFDVAWLENKRVVTSPAMQSKQELEAAWNNTKVVDDFINSPAFVEALQVGERRRSMCSS